MFDCGADYLAADSVAFAVEQAATAAAFPDSELALVDLVFRFFAVGVVEGQSGFASLFETCERAAGGGVNKDLLVPDQVGVGFEVAVEFAEMVEVGLSHLGPEGCFEHGIVA